jgi:hypothetical protein
MSDYVEFTLLPSLVRVCAKIAPGVTLSVRAVDRGTGLDLLDASAIDLATSEALFSERWVCVGCDCNDALPVRNAHGQCFRP